MFEAVLFDWRGTLFTDEAELDWIRNAATSIGRVLSDDEAASILEQGEAVLRERRDLQVALDRSDVSVEAHRSATLAWLRAAGLDDELAIAIWARDGHPDASFPFPDTAPVLRDLHVRGIRVAIVSDIHYDLRDHFAHHGLAEFVDAYVLSYAHGCQKPDAEMFELALDALGVTSDRALMVGDRASHDGGAAAIGIATFILPSLGHTSSVRPRGLDAVLRLVGTSAG